MEDAISSDKRLSEGVAAAHKILLDVVGLSGAQVREAWALRKDTNDRPLIHLNLSDFTAQVQDDFEPDELKNPRQMRYRLYRLWGDLLQDRSHKQLKELVEADSSGGGANGA